MASSILLVSLKESIWTTFTCTLYISIFIHIFRNNFTAHFLSWLDAFKIFQWSFGFVASKWDSLGDNFFLWTLIQLFLTVLYCLLVDFTWPLFSVELFYIKQSFCSKMEFPSSGCTIFIKSGLDTVIIHLNVSNALSNTKKFIAEFTKTLQISVAILLTMSLQIFCGQWYLI